MRMPSGVNELEGAPEGIAKARSIVPHHGQAAASFWSIEREGRNDGVPPKLQAPLKSLDISSAVAVLGQKVERCAIVPNVVSPWRVPGGRVRDNPMNLSGTATKTGLGSSQRRLG